MPSNKYNIELVQGDTFSLNLTVKEANNAPKNLSGYSARMQVRPSYDSNTVSESLSTANGEITINTSVAMVSLFLTPARTSAMKVDLTSGGIPPKSRYVYDLELIDGANNVTKLIYGELFVYGEVTR